MKKFIAVILLSVFVMGLSACGFDNLSDDVDRQKTVSEILTSSQQTPTDIDYSLERYNLIRRAYWVNGQREKANTLICEVDKPLGYIVLFTDNGAVVGRFIVDGKVSSLNSFLTPNSVDKYYSGSGAVVNIELADVDGSYGENESKQDGGEL